MAKKQPAPTASRNGIPKQVYLKDDEWKLIEEAAALFDRGNMSALIIRGALAEARRVIKESGGV